MFLSSQISTCTQIVFNRDHREYIGTFISFKDLTKEHFAIGLGDWKNVKTPIVRIHSECLTGDVFGSLRCDCGDQLTEALQLISEKGGFVLYLRQEGRGIGLYNKFKAYNLQDQGHDTYEANKILGFKEDMRSFDIAAYMLRALDINEIHLFTNNNRKKAALEKEGIKINSIISTNVYLNEHNEKYLKSKKEKGNHNLNF